MSRNPIFCGWKWSDWVSATQIEPSCDGIGLELSSVDQKVFVIVIWSLSDSGIFLFSNRYMDIVSPKLRFADLVRDGCLRLTRRRNKGDVIRGSKPNSNRVRVKFQNFHVIRYEKSLTITMYRFLPYLLPYFSK